MIQNLQKKLEFIELMDQMKNIERAILLKNRRQESNADHSFHLAMMVIVFAEDFPQLDTYKCVKLALIHDLVEIYAGDTIVLDIEHEKTKEERERAAVYKFAAEFGNNIFEGLIDLMNDYEEKNSAESKFVYSLDKVQPIIQVVNEG
ncbi:MAG: HD domain-containing protein [Patescibacteria group bacterium]|nr:HD domain-containing protein [Patescibacteria group bacterium]